MSRTAKKIIGWLLLGVLISAFLTSIVIVYGWLDLIAFFILIAFVCLLGLSIYLITGGK
jgi:hypothetical protein